MLRRLLLPLAIIALNAQATVTSYSPPVGGMTITVPAGQTRTIAVPLLHGCAGSGKMRGAISGIGTNYIDVSDANWTAGALSSSNNPYYLHILSGSAQGRVLPVIGTPNTSTRLYINNDSIDLEQSNVVNGDKYEIVMADTLGSLFGNSTLLGGTDSSSADNVLVWGGASWICFYYNTTRSRWERNVDTAASPSRDTYVLRPDRGIMITRRAATDLTLEVFGRVPTVAPRLAHSSPGVTFLCDGLPVNVTLGDLSLQTRISGWLASSSGSEAVTSADYIQIWGGASWLTFYYNSTNHRWQRNTDIDASPSRDTYTIPAGRPFMIRRLNSPTSVSDKLIDFPLPYSVSS